MEEPCASCPTLILGLPVIAQSICPVQERADRFLRLVNAGYQSLNYVDQEAVWVAATDVSPSHDASANTAGKALAAFTGNPILITEVKELLNHRAELNPITVRELDRVLVYAAEGPMTNAVLTADRIEAETAQASTMNGLMEPGRQAHHRKPDR